MTGYYMDGLRGLTTLKLFDRDREHSRVLGEKADVLNKNINAFMENQFHILPCGRAFDLCGHHGFTCDFALPECEMVILQSRKHLPF